MESNKLLKIIGIIGIGLGILTGFAFKAPILIYPMLILDAVWLIAIGGLNLLINKNTTSTMPQANTTQETTAPLPYVDGMVIACKVCRKPMQTMRVKEGIELYCPNCGRHLIVHKENIRIPIRIINEGTPTWQKAVKTLGENAKNVHLTDNTARPPKLID